MEARHEIISFDHSSPVRLFMQKLGNVSHHWHESLELLFVLSGELSVLAGDLHAVLKQDDILLVNSNVVHELHSENCVLIGVQIKLSKFDIPADLLQSLYFDCNSLSGRSPDSFYRIKRIIASMLQVNAADNDTALFRSRALAYDLVSELTQNFKVDKPKTEINSRKHLERLNNILRYINDHYQEQLTLSQLAEREHLSAPYLSRFFEKYMGVNFFTYYTNLRLEHAFHDLLYSDIPVVQVALNNGFSDTRAFVRAFKARYNTVPSAYRKNAGSSMIPSQKDPLLAINYLDFKPENYLHILSQYLPDSAPVSAPTAPCENRTFDIGEIDSTRVLQPLSHKWRTLIGVGRAKELLYAEIQDMLRQLQRDVGFRYLRFHGIFSDDMLVCRANQDGTLQFSFALIDKVLDFILSIGLKPLIQFSFMPAALAAEPEHTVFASPFTISPPRKMEDWNQLVTQFLVHIQKRYSSEEIRSWLFSVWNEPDTSQHLFGFKDIQQFYDLYESTWKTVKDFDPELTFGSPSLFPTTDYEVEWLKNYLRFARAHQCPPQFIDVHYYSNNFWNDPALRPSFSTPSTFSDDPDHFGKFLTKLQECLAEENAGHLPLYITEWNLTLSHRSLINDTCFKATYLAKNFLENYDRADAIGYWSLTDFLEEYQLSHQTFHGGMGLFTLNGIKKPSYYVMQMLRQLGDTLIASGKGYFITRQGKQIIMILYHYEHFNTFFLQEGFGMTLTSRDGAFPNASRLDVSLTLTGLAGGAYRIRETILNQEHGSCYDLWVSMGAPELDSHETEWLRHTAHPALRSRQIPVPQGVLRYSATLAPHEVRLVKIAPLDAPAT